MAYVEVECVYEDGRESDVVRFKPKAWLAIERKFGTDFPAREGAYYGAWVQLAPGVGFDEWVDSLESVTERVVDPSKEATASPEASPPSQ